MAGRQHRAGGVQGAGRYEEVPIPSSSRRGRLYCRQQLQHSEQSRSTQHDVVGPFLPETKALGDFQEPGDTVVGFWGSQTQETRETSNQYSHQGPPQGHFGQPFSQTNSYQPLVERDQYFDPPQDAQPPTLASTQENIDLGQAWSLGEIEVAIGDEVLSNQPTQSHLQIGWQNALDYSNTGRCLPDYDESPPFMNEDPLDQWGLSAGTENLPGHLQRQPSNMGQRSETLSNTSADTNRLLNNPSLGAATFEPLETDMNRTNAEPWSFFRPNDGYQTYQCDERQWVPQEETSDTTHSMDTHDNIASSHEPDQDPTMSMSSTDQDITEMANSMTLTEKPHDSQRLPKPHQFTSNDALHLFQCRIERSATPQASQYDVGPLNTNPHTPHPESENGHLAPPMQDALSDIPSSPTDASSPAAPDIIYCDVNGCMATFSGAYRKGNKARHRRQYHKGPKVYVCGDGLCDKVFRRQDARLKHYRRYHPSLAAESPYVARGSHPRRTDNDQDIDLSNISGWT